MAGKSLSPADLAQAVAAYCNANGKTFSTSEDGKIRIFAGAPGDGDPIVWLDAGCLQAAPVEVGLNIMQYMPQDRARGANLAVRGNRQVSGRSPVEAPSGSALEAVRACQATEKATYSTGGKRKAAAAKTNIAALIEAGGSLEVVKRIHTPDYIEVIGRATLGDQHTDGSRSFYKQEYLAKKAWEWIIKVLIKEPEIVSGVDKYGMPEFKEGAIIKVRISDEDRNSFLVALPAKIALWREMAREWQAAGRVCETVAYSRASDMLLRGDFQSKEEIAEEQAEIDGIQNAAKAEAGA
ncbi:hypothetical protein M0R72_20440 [Candidatus Pacearchaeota archaeon]|jgi:hypothetical protein|nr:hypothetical protein [Candidatus Pacearchaeota archaeon]